MGSLCYCYHQTPSTFYAYSLFKCSQFILSVVKHYVFFHYVLIHNYSIHK